MYSQSLRRHSAMASPLRRPWSVPINRLMSVSPAKGGVWTRDMKTDIRLLEQRLSPTVALTLWIGRSLLAGDFRYETVPGIFVHVVGGASTRTVGFPGFLIRATQRAYRQNSLAQVGSEAFAPKRRQREVWGIAGRIDHRDATGMMRHIYRIYVMHRKCGCHGGAVPKGPSTACA